MSWGEIGSLISCPSLVHRHRLVVYQQGGRPYVAVFLRKEREWSERAEGAAEGDSVDVAFPEVISSLDEIHHVGTLAQVWRQLQFPMYLVKRMGAT